MGASGDYQTTVAEAALASLQRLSPDSVPLIIEFLRSSRRVRDTRFRLPLVELLGRLGSDARPALPILQLVTTDPETTVAERARVAIDNIQANRRSNGP